MGFFKNTLFEIADFLDDIVDKTKDNLKGIHLKNNYELFVEEEEDYLSNNENEDSDDDYISPYYRDKYDI